MAVAAISVAVPAAAQHYGPPRGGPAYGQQHAGPPMAVRVRHLERNVAFAHRARVMSTGKARDSSAASTAWCTSSVNTAPA
ncbi:hypothetical protein [Brevundimonas denitrificans]|uniref:hypothetical protein n=1 Tax=Brevundimonas denitrificans TaxID=1443434 RepID=UPI00223B86B5|nr:hypothetical protein [Brevundimonas denitrificans]